MTLKATDRKWKEFSVSDFFEIQIGRNIDGNKVDKNSGSIPYITRKEVNNGNDGFLSHDPSYLFSNTPAITIGNETAAPFVQRTPFFTGTKVNIMKPKENIPSNALFFVSQCIRQHKNKYSFSYTINSTRLKRQTILLPVSQNGEPDWFFMDQYSRKLLANKKSKYAIHCREQLNKLKYKNIKSIEEKQWREFFLKDIFQSVQRGRRLTKRNQTPGNTPYISSTSNNNGVNNFIDNDSKVRVFSNCLTIANSGSVGSSFYHPYTFVASDHVTHLKHEEFSSFTYMFIATQTNSLSKKYNFNREINDKRISREKILLPVTKKGKPDYKYMEQYMMNLEYKKRKQYLIHFESENSQ